MFVGGNGSGRTAGHAGLQAYPQPIRARQVEHFGRSFASCAEPVGRSGAQIARVARSEGEPGAGQDQLDPPDQDAHPCVALVAQQVRCLVGGQDKSVHLDPTGVLGEATAW